MESYSITCMDYSAKNTSINMSKYEVPHRTLAIVWYLYMCISPADSSDPSIKYVIWYLISISTLSIMEGHEVKPQENRQVHRKMYCYLKKDVYDILIFSRDDTCYRHLVWSQNGWPKQ